MLHIGLSPCLIKKKKTFARIFHFSRNPLQTFLFPSPKFVARKVSHVVWNRNASFHFFLFTSNPQLFFSFQLLSLLLWNWVSFNLIRTIVGGDFRGETRFLTKKLLQKYFFCHLSNWPTSKLFWERLLKKNQLFCFIQHHLWLK